MRRRHFSTFLWTVLALGFVIVLGVGIWFYRDQQQVQRREVAKDLTAIAQLKAEQIVAWRKDQLADADIQKYPFLLTSVAHVLAHPTERHLQDLRTRFRAVARQHDYTDILLVDTSGKTHLSLSEPTPRHRMYLPSLDTALRERRPVFADLHTEPQGGAPHISVVWPLFADEKVQKPLGALVLITDASRFLFPLLQSWPTPSETGQTLLVRRDGDHVLFLNDLRHQPDTALNLRLPLSRKELPAVMAALGKEGFVETKDHQGIEVAAVILQIPESPWLLVSKISADEAFADRHHQSRLLLALLVGLILLFGALVLVLLQREKKAHFQTLYHSEVALRTAMERHSTTLKAIGDAVIATDAQGRVELVNPVAEKLTGWKQEEASGKPLDEVFRIVSAHTGQKADDPVSRVLLEGIVAGLANHTILISRDGQEYQIADSAAPIKDSDGTVTGVVLVFRDVTDEYQMRQALRDAEHYYRSLIHSLHEDILVIDREYRVTDINNSALRSLSLSRDDAVGRRCHELSHRVKMPCHETGEPCGLLRVFETGKPCNLHHEHVNAQGDRIYIDLLCSPLKDATGKVTHMIEAARDVTDLFRAHEEVAASEEKYRRLFETMAQGVVYQVPNGEIISINPSAARILGISPDRIEGKTSSDTDWNPIREDGSELPGPEHPSMVALRTGQRVIDFTMGVRNQQTGKRVWLNVSAIPLFRPHEEHPFQVYTTFTDITDRKWEEEEKSKLQAQLRQAQKMESIGTLAGGIAHDFNNALTPIMVQTELAKLNIPADSPVQEGLDEIMKAGHRAKELVKQILTFSRQSEQQRLPVDLTPMVKECMKMLRSSIPTTIDIRQDIAEVSCTVMADPTQMHQIVMNLCTNASQAMQETGGLLEVSLKPVKLNEREAGDYPDLQAGGYIMLTVSDTGAGIESELMEKIFDPFFTTKPVGEGTGMGLSVVHGIVRSHGGDIAVQSRPGKGTVFTVLLPRLEHETDMEAETVDRSIPAGSERIMFVDDEDSMVKLGEQVLTRLGYRVTVKKNGVEALAAFRQQPDKYDLIITDMTMPNMTGDNLATALMGIRPDIPVIICTGFSEQMDKQKASALGIRAFVMKPFMVKDIAETIRNVLDANGA